MRIERLARYQRNTRGVGDQFFFFFSFTRRGRGIFFFYVFSWFFFFAEICILLKCRPRASGSYHRYATLINLATLRTVRSQRHHSRGRLKSKISSLAAKIWSYLREVSWMSSFVLQKGRLSKRPSWMQVREKSGFLYLALRSRSRDPEKYRWRRIGFVV